QERLSRYCDTATEKGAQPILITSVERRFFTGDGSVLYTHGEYPAAMRALAAKKGVPLCDLQKRSRDLYLSLGEAKTAELFVRLAPGENPDFPDGHDDKTHFNAHGAAVIAGLVAEELRKIPVAAPFFKPEKAE
ncbi:MAG: rhamnogalacturonan acetylesterase, partial [Clostridia bacterium]|nr:rhamnogalacturonan acetylesterase [Clostridia bacterium]